MMTDPAPSFANPGVLTPPDTIRFERRLPGPVERVWAYLTEPEKRAKWLAGGTMELRPGGRAELQFHHRSVTDETEATPERFRKFDGGVTQACRVIRAEAPRLLVLSWPGSNGGESEVTFELSAAGPDVLLTLTHRRVSSRDDLRMVSSGWHTHLAILEDELHRRARRAFWSNFAGAESEYSRLISKM